MSPDMVAETYTPTSDYAAWFWAQTASPHCRRVLEVGTLQAVPGLSTHLMAEFPNVKNADYVRLDIEPGADVDVVGDIHALPQEWSGRFDAFVASAVWEHLERPWIAAREVARVLAPGGKFLVITHQTFPLHGFPKDFFRFSRDALRLLFEDAGLIVEACDYRNRCLIAPMPPIVPREALEIWNRTYPSFVHVGAAGRKPE
jgi:SAM-dependent methyltransferase